MENRGKTWVGVGAGVEDEIEGVDVDVGVLDDDGDDEAVAVGAMVAWRGSPWSCLGKAGVSSGTG